MSQALAPFNVSGLAVGESGSIDLTQVMNIGGLTPNKKPTIRLHNDSGSGLYVVLPSSGQSFNFPAGGWQDCQLQPGESAIDFTVLYLLPDPPVTLLMATFYGPNEDVPAMTILGNSPVGIGGTINTSNTSLINDGNNPLTTIIESTPNDAALSTWKADNSGNLTIKGDNAGTLSTLLQLIAGASPGVKLAAAAILTEVLGNLQVDGNLIANGGMNITTIRDDTTGATQATLATAGITVQKILTLLAGLAVTGSSSLDNGNITTDGSGNLNLVAGLLEIAGVTVLSKGANTHLNAPALAQILFDIGGVNVASIDSSGVNAINGVNYNIGRIKDINTGTVAASGTVNHGLSGSPAAVLMTPDVAGSTWTVSANTYTSTQFSCTLNSALTTRWVAYR